MKKNVEEDLRREILQLKNEIAALRWEIRALKAPIDVFGRNWPPRYPEFPGWPREFICKGTI